MANQQNEESDLASSERPWDWELKPGRDTGEPPRMDTPRPGRSGPEQPASIKNSNSNTDASQVPQVSPASDEAGAQQTALVPEKRLKKTAVASSPTVNNEGALATNVSTSSGVRGVGTAGSGMAAGARLSVTDAAYNDNSPLSSEARGDHGNYQLSRNSGVHGYDVHTQQEASSWVLAGAAYTGGCGAGTAADKLHLHDGGTTSRDEGQLDLMQREQALEGGVHHLEVQEGGVHHLELEEGGVHHPEVQEGGGLDVDLRRERRRREEYWWGVNCLTCRELEPDVMVKPCCHPILCCRCFLDPYAHPQQWARCPVCLVPSEGLLFSKDMLKFLILRSQGSQQ